MRGLHLLSSSSWPLVLPRRAQHNMYSSAAFEMARQEEKEDRHCGMEQMSVVENGRARVLPQGDVPLPDDVHKESSQ